MVAWWVAAARSLGNNAVTPLEVAWEQDKEGIQCYVAVYAWQEHL